MKKTIIILPLIAFLIWPNLSLAIEFTPKEIENVVQITSFLPKEAIDMEIRSLAGFYSDEELMDYRNQLEVQTQLGSGLMVTYSGCVLTNKHVVYNEEVAAVYQEIHLWSTDNPHKSVIDLGEAQVVFRATLLDIALVCLKDSQGKYYSHSRLNSDDYRDFKLTLGEEIYNLGYPLGGEQESLTLTSGVVSGVWDEDYLKSDLAITGGASGSPIFSADKRVIGLASGNGGEYGSYGVFIRPDHVYGWHNLYKLVYRELIEDSKGCSDTEQFGLYQKEGQEYYDLSCKNKRNFGLEAKLVFEHRQYCQTDLNQNELIEISAYISSGKSTINHYLSYLETSCLASELPVTVFEASAE